MGYYLGIDSGSTAAKVVVLKDEEIAGKLVIPTGASSSQSINRAVEQVLVDLQLQYQDIAATVATGYGRRNFAGTNKQITEISCHAKGVHHLHPTAEAIIDIGGQDFKVIRLDKKGAVIDFRMNDKCAAGTGRFMSVMAKALELDLREFGELALGARGLVEITSVCTVFAESEVINHIARGTPVPEIAYAIFNAVATRVFALAKQLVESVDVVVFTGGGALNPGLVKALKNKLGKTLIVPQEPQFTGALGAALYARDLDSAKH